MLFTVPYLYLPSTSFMMMTFSECDLLCFTVHCYRKLYALNALQADYKLSLI